MKPSVNTYPLKVVDINTTSLVTPRLRNMQHCHTHEPETCSHNSCLNGGRCAKLNVENRCVFSYRRLVCLNEFLCLHIAVYACVV